MQPGEGLSKYACSVERSTSAKQQPASVVEIWVDDVECMGGESKGHGSTGTCSLWLVMLQI